MKTRPIRSEAFVFTEKIQEGYRAAHEVFRNNGLDPKAQTYEDLPVTNEEMFFFSNALPLCMGPLLPDKPILYVCSFCSTERQIDSHSETFLRANAVLKQSEEFAAFYSCKQGDPMFLSPDKFCGFYGDRYVPTGRKDQQ